MRAVGSLLVLLVINAVLSSEFYVSAEECDPSHCTNPNCQISNNTCSCVLGYSGMNCSIAACDREDACPENEDCKMNTIYVGRGFDCIPRACSALNCTASETCGRLSNRENYMCLSNLCISDSRCNSTNGKCHYSPQHNNITCLCKPGYDSTTGCNVEVPCHDDNECQNGGTCRKSGGRDIKTCNCSGGYRGLRCETDICDSLKPCVNGGCSVISSPPYYTCSCKKGYMGYNCSKLSGPCDFNGTCLNNGTCMVDDDDVGGYKCLCTDDWDPATNCSTRIDHCRSNPCDQGTCVSNSSHYTCDCNEDYYGRNCTFNNPCECQNGGTCVNNTTCECVNGYIGPKCGIRDHCVNSSCNQTTARCVNNEDSFTCECKSGYTGDDCSLDQCTCSGRGECMRNDTSHWCVCDPGYTGDKCQYRLCTSNSCYYSGNCTNGDMEHYTCSCPEWATGTRCESLVTLVLPGLTVPNITDCPRDCAQKRKDGKCDAKCNVGVCDFDGGDCEKICNDVTSENISCHDVFKNGICNPECNSVECLQDGIDCRQNLPFCPNRSCGDGFGNGNCSQACNNAECQFDGGDCKEEKQERIILRGLLFIVIRATREDFYRNTNRFLFEIAEVLNCIPILVGVKDADFFGNRAKRQDSKNSSLEVDLKLDVTQCNNTTETCVGSVEDASNIIGNLSENRGFKPAGHEILETGTIPPPTPPTPPPTPPVTLGSIIGITIGVVIISAIVLSAGIVIKRKRKAVIWRPEGPNNTPRSNSYEEDLPTGKRYVPGKERSSKDLHSETDDYPMKPMGEKEEWVDVPGEMDTNCSSATFVVGQIQRDPPSWSALHYKALRQPSMVHELVTKFNEETDTSIDVNIRGPGGYTSLMVAVMLGNVQRDGEDESDYECTRPSLINGSEAASPPRSLTVKDLLRMKADPNLKNDLGQTALHIAAACSRADVTRLLLSNRADPNAQDCNGRSPLHIAVTSEAEGVFQLLLRHKNTNPDLDAEDGTTPLILATQHHSVSMVEQLLKEAHVDANTQDKGGKTALHWAASMNMMDIMKILLKQGANKDSQDNNGQTPLFLAAKVATDKGAEVEPNCEERPSKLTSLMTTFRITSKNTGPSTVIPLLITVLLMSARSDVPVATRQEKYRPKIFQVLKEIAPEVDPELILQQLSSMETDDLVDCSVKVARKYRELEEENENYRKRKDTFVTLYQKEQGRVRELEGKLVEVKKEMNRLRVKHRSELDQIRQEYLNERRRLEEECAELRVRLEHMKHSKGEWTKEKQYLLQKVRNEKLQLSEMRQSKEVERNEEKVQEVQIELLKAKQDKSQLSKELRDSKHKSEMLSRMYEEYKTRIDELLMEQLRDKQEVTRLKNQLDAVNAENIIVLRKENNNLRNAVHHLEQTKVQKDNENAAILLQLREYQKKYGAFGPSYSSKYRTSDRTVVADGIKRASIHSDRKVCPFCQKVFDGEDQSGLLAHVNQCTSTP